MKKISWHLLNTWQIGRVLDYFSNVVSGIRGVCSVLNYVYQSSGSSPALQRAHEIEPFRPFDRRTSLAELTCALLLPLVVHAAFARYPERAAEMAVLNHETCAGEGERIATAAAGGGEMPMSCAFVRQNLAQSFYLQVGVKFLQLPRIGI